MGGTGGDGGRWRKMREDEGRGAVEAALDPKGQKMRRRNLTALAFPWLGTRTLRTCAALHHTALHHTALHHTSLHHTSLHHTAPHCTTLHHNTAPHCTTLHHNTAPHCTTTVHHTAPPHQTKLHHNVQTPRVHCSASATTQFWESKKGG